MEIRETYAAWAARIFEQHPDAVIKALFRADGCISALANVDGQPVEGFPKRLHDIATAVSEEPSDAEIIADVFKAHGLKPHIEMIRPIDQDVKIWRVYCGDGCAEVQISGLEELMNKAPSQRHDLLKSRAANAVKVFTQSNEAA